MGWERHARGLKGEETPLAARAFAVVAVWDALHSNCPYSEARPDAEALELIHCMAGTHFDPHVVEALMSVWASEE